MKSTHCFIYILLSGLLVFPLFSNGQQIKKVPISINGEDAEFLIYFPANYDASPDDFPVLFFLHGGQGILDGLGEEGAYTQPFGPMYLASNSNNRYTPWPVSSEAGELVLVSPYLPRDESIPNKNDQEWPVDFIKGFVDYVKDHYKIDENRVYMTGISVGAKGTWDYAFEYPNDLAAAVPISGTVDIPKTNGNVNCDAIDDMPPVWALHGLDDGLVEPYYNGSEIDGRYGTALASELINDNCSPSIPLRTTLIDGFGHDHWNEYYELSVGYNLYKWMLRFNKADNSNKAPLANSGGSYIKIAEQDHPLVIQGFGYDPEDISVTTAIWTKESGPSVLSGSMQQDEGTLTLTNLSTGDYIFKLTVTDSNGASDFEEINIVVTPTLGATGISELVLSTASEGDIVLSDGFSISTQDLGTEFGIRATPTSSVAAVMFGENNNQNLYNDKSSPFMLSDWNPENGTYYISATAFTNKNPNRNQGYTLKYRINVQESPLPVEFQEVKAQKTAEGVKIEWLTASEKNNDFFTVERSISGSVADFTPIGQVSGAGNSKVALNYSYLDKNSITGKYYYRIKQTDYDGKFAYSTVVSANIDEAGNNIDVSVYPNPAPHGRFYLRLRNGSGEPMHVQLFDSVGILQTKTFSEGLNHEVEWIPGRDYKAGIYILRIRQGDRTINKKLAIY